MLAANDGQGDTGRRGFVAETRGEPRDSYSNGKGERCFSFMSKGEIISRAASLAVAALCLSLVASDKVATNLQGPMTVGLLFGLLLIWFPERLGSATGFIGHGRVDTETPAALVAFMGWVFLLGVPALIAILSK